MGNLGHRSRTSKTMGTLRGGVNCGQRDGKGRARGKDDVGFEQCGTVGRVVGESGKKAAMRWR